MQFLGKKIPLRKKNPVKALKKGVIWNLFTRCATAVGME